MSETWLGFLGGLLTALVAGLIASIAQRHNEKIKRKEEARLEIYFLLMELSTNYFWVASADLRDESPPNEMIERSHEIAWKIAEKLRIFDQVEFLDEILEVLFDAHIPSANDRAKKLDALIGKYGKLVNPKYSKHIMAISQSNVVSLGLGTKSKSYAPGLWHWPK
jgi:hypothetical protein